MTTYTPPDFAAAVSREAVTWPAHTPEGYEFVGVNEDGDAIYRGWHARVLTPPQPTMPPQPRKFWRDLLSLQPRWKTLTAYRLMALHMELAADGPTYKHTARRKGNV